MNAIPSAHLIPRYPPHVHTGTWGTLETFTPAVRANKVRTARRAKRNNDSSYAASQEDLLHAEHDAPDHGHGRDQAVPGPADSLEGRQALAVKRWTSRLPGKHFPHLTGAEQNASYAGTAVEFTVKYGNVSAPSAAPSSNSPSSSDALPLRLRHPRARPGRRPTLRRPAP